MKNADYIIIVIIISDIDTLQFNHTSSLSSSYVYFIALEVWFQYKGNIFNLWFSCIASFHYIKDLLSVTKIIYLQDISIKNGNNSITQIMFTNLLNRNSFKICNFVFMLKSQFYASHSTLLDEENLNLRKKKNIVLKKVSDVFQSLTVNYYDYFPK